MRRIGKDKKCEKCGKIVKPGGIGSHMRLAHGIKVKTVVNHLSEDSGHSSGNLSHSSGNLSHLTDNLSHSSHSSHSSERIQRPSDYVRKRTEKVVEIRTEPFNLIPLENYKCKDCGKWYKIDEYQLKSSEGTASVQYCWACYVKRNQGLDSLGRLMCKNCGGWFVPDTIPHGYDCVPGKRHEFNT